MGVCVLIGTADSFQNCEHTRKSHDAYKALHEEGAFLVKPIVRLKLHAAASINDGAITALSGVAVAFFTFTLWWVTWGMVRRGDLARSIAAAEKSADAAGVIRRMGWCRRYDFALLRFCRTDDPDNEYAD